MTRLYQKIPSKIPIQTSNLHGRNQCCSISHRIQSRKHSNQRGSVVSASLSLHEIPPPIGELVVAAGPTDDRPDDHVGVGAPAAVPVVVPLGAPHEGLGVPVGLHGRAAVVHPLGVVPPVPDQVAEAHGIGAQDVAHLRLDQ